MNTDIETYEFENPDLEAAVDKLDPDDRRIIILRLMGFTYAELGEIMDFSEQAAWKRVAAITKKIKELV